MKSYDYADREGIEAITWERFGTLSRALAERVAPLQPEVGAAGVVTASLVAHSWASPMPDAVALLTDAFVVFPWDAEVWTPRGWEVHPEIAEGLRAQEAPAGGPGGASR